MLMKKMTKISGIVVVIIGGINLLLSLISGKGNEALKVVSNIFSFLFPLAIMIFLASANRKEDISKIASFVTFLGCFVLVILQFLILFEVVKVSLFSGNYIFMQILIATYLVTVGATFISLVGNTNTEDGLVVTLKNISIYLMIGVVGCFLLTLFFPKLASSMGTNLMGMGSSVSISSSNTMGSILGICFLVSIGSGLFSVVLDKVQVFEDMEDISKQCISYQENVKKLNEQVENDLKEKKDLTEKIGRLEQLLGAYDPNYAVISNNEAMNYNQTMNTQGVEQVVYNNTMNVMAGYQNTIPQQAVDIANQGYGIALPTVNNISSNVEVPISTMQTAVPVINTTNTQPVNGVESSIQNTVSTSTSTNSTCGVIPKIVPKGNVQ